WRALTDAQRRWVVEGGDDWTGKWQTQWYGIRRFFDWLESKAYKMHIRVLLSKYRSYTPCTSCRGARLKPDALLWRVGSLAQADAALSRAFGSREAGRVGEEDSTKRVSGSDSNPPRLPPAAHATDDEASAATADDASYARFMPAGVEWNDAQLRQLAGLSIHDLMLLPIDRVAGFFDALTLPAPL